MKRNRSGFTLVELMAVMVIMAIMLAVAVGAFIDFGRGASIRGSTAKVLNALNLARQRAITYRCRTRFVYGNTTTLSGAKGYFVISTNGVCLDGTNYLEDGIVFTNLTKVETNEFEIDGGCGGVGTKTLVLAERDRGPGFTLSNSITLFLLTGQARAGD